MTLTMNDQTYSDTDLEHALNQGLANHQVTHEEVVAARTAGTDSDPLRVVIKKVINHLGCYCCGHPEATCNC